MFPIDFLYRAALSRPDAPAVQAGDAVIPYRRLVAEVRALAAGLQAQAGRARITVAVLSPNSLDLFRAVMAVHAAGGVVVPLNPRNAAVELQAQARRARPDIIVVEPGHRSLLDGIEGPRVLTHPAEDGTVTVADLLERFAGAAPDWPDVGLHDVNGIKFTGGSSGVPKAVLQSFRVVNTVVVNMLLAFGFCADDRYLVSAPMTHGAGMFMLPVLAAGGVVHIPEHGRPEDLVAAMRAHPVTALWVPPTLLYKLTEAAADRPRSFPALRHLVYGGAPCPPDKIRAAQRVFGPVVEVVYGQTEASTIATAMRAADLEEERNLESVGPSCGLTRVAVVDPQGAVLPAGAHGEIVIGGDLLMNGYLDMPEVTAETIRNGWLHTGDVGYLDERGYLYIKDRLRDVVISGGFNVYPSDVEAALARHPDVREALVFGVPDDVWGERVEAAVELRPGATADAEALLAFARTQVGAVKAPKRIHVLAELPRSAVGKTLRREARALLAGQ